MASTTNETLKNTEIPKKDIFTLHFLQSLMYLTTQTTSNSPTDRVKKIKTAAYVSMAKSAGGSSRRWSRALFWRLQNKRMRIFPKRKRLTWQRRKTPAANKLRKIVPGGEGMEPVKLMEETVHFIKCLSMQVNVMQSIVDTLSHHGHDHHHSS